MWYGSWVDASVQWCELRGGEQSEEQQPGSSTRCSACVASSCVSVDSGERRLGGSAFSASSCVSIASGCVSIASDEHLQLGFQRRCGRLGLQRRRQLVRHELRCRRRRFQQLSFQHRRLSACSSAISSVSSASSASSTALSSSVASAAVSGSASSSAAYGGTREVGTVCDAGFPEPCTDYTRSLWHWDLGASLCTVLQGRGQSALGGGLRPAVA